MHIPYPRASGISLLLLSLMLTHVFLIRKAHGVGGFGVFAVSAKVRALNAHAVSLHSRES